jgi:hypothetical protein
MVAALQKAGFRKALASDLWRGGSVREGTVSQLIIAERD